MKRMLAATMAGLMLVGSQAAATTGVARVGDRAGAAEETSNEFMGMPLPVILLTIVIIGGFVWAVSEGDDGPSSP